MAAVRTRNTEGTNLCCPPLLEGQLLLLKNNHRFKRSCHRGVDEEQWTALHLKLTLSEWSLLWLLCAVTVVYAVTVCGVLSLLCAVCRPYCVGCAVPTVWDVPSLPCAVCRHHVWCAVPVWWEVLAVGLSPGLAEA